LANCKFSSEAFRVCSTGINCLELDWAWIRKPYMLLTVLAVLTILSFSWSVYGQLPITVSPPQPLAYQPISFYGSNGTYRSSATVYIFQASATGNCTYPPTSYPGGVSSTVVYKYAPVQIDSEGIFSLTLPNGLPVGYYCVLARASYNGNSYTSVPTFFVVRPNTPYRPSLAERQSSSF